MGWSVFMQSCAPAPHELRIDTGIERSYKPDRPQVARLVVRECDEPVRQCRTPIHSDFLVLGVVSFIETVDRIAAVFGRAWRCAPPSA